MSDSEQKTVLILGAGQAGAQCAVSLRRNGWDGRILLAGDEPHPPYQRPPLSKAYLAGEIEADRLWLQSLETWREQSVELLLDHRATRIDRGKQSVEFENGTRIEYDYLVLAMGARVRPLPVPGAEMEGVRYLRTIADIDHLKAAVLPGKRIAIIGGGYIGLEAAAVARKLGAQPVVIEAMERLLARVAHPDLSSFFLGAHRQRGVEVHLSSQVERLDGPHGHVASVILSEGQSIACDSVLVGIGVLPNQELAAACGLETGNGIRADEAGQTSDPNIFAIGDCTEAFSPIYQRALRLESVPNAIEQGKAVAASICGTPLPAREPPWFWSDQFELKFQSVGLMEGADRAERRPGANSDSFALFHFAGERLLAVDAVNDPASFMAGKMMISKGVSPDPDQIANTGVPIKDLMKAAMKAP